MRKPLSYFIVLLVALGGVVACKPKQPADTIPFDKGALLTNFSNNLISPALENYAVAVTQLEVDFQAFAANRTEVNLTIVRESWKDAYLKWQHVKPFDFGPIRDYGLKAATNTYPADTVKIQNNISTGGYTLASASNIDAIGFAGLDFLLFRTTALNAFVTSETTTTYALELIQKMKTEAIVVKNAWAGYKAQFVASTGTETTSAFSQLINEFNRDYELAKNAKLGIPMGKQSLGVALPEYIEAKWRGFSFELLRESVVSLRKIYLGANGVGFDDYLKHLEKADLHNAIDTKFGAILSQIDIFSVSLEQAITSNTAELETLYLLMSEQVVKLKTDMTSSFGVLITYQDNDGD